MPAERFFLDTDFIKDSTILLEEEEHHHLSRVMRLRVGESVEIINGRGFLALGHIETIGKQQTSLMITDVHHEPPPATKIILAQGIPKPNRLDIIVEKGTELGMGELRLFPGEWSEKKEMSPTQMQRCRHLAISALKQCGALYLPEIVIYPPLKEWEPPSHAYFGDLTPNAPKLTDVYKQGQPQVIFFVGPEKGFSPQETKILTQWAQGVSLHRNILRTETAAICAVTQISMF